MCSLHTFLNELDSSGFLDRAFPLIDFTFLSSESNLPHNRSFHLGRIVNSINSQYSTLIPHLILHLHSSSSYVDFRDRLNRIDQAQHLSVRQFLIDLDALLCQIYFSSPHIISNYLPDSDELSHYVSESSKLDLEFFSKFLSSP